MLGLPFTNLMMRIFRPIFPQRILPVQEVRVGESIYLRVPVNAPKEVFDSLSRLFKMFPEILSAYLAVGYLDKGEPLHYIVGIQIDSKYRITIEELLTQMAGDFKTTIPRGIFVDCVQVKDENAPISNFMREYLIPFYSRDFK